MSTARGRTSDVGIEGGHKTEDLEGKKKGAQGRTVHGDGGKTGKESRGKRRWLNQWEVVRCRSRLEGP